MAVPSKPAAPYVSPLVLAERILARAEAGEAIAKPMLCSAQRIKALSSWFVHELERHKAPYRVARWVASGEAMVRKRLDLALLVRTARPTKGWPDTGGLKAAFGVYLQARPPGAAGGFIQVSSVPVERYLAAIDAQPKRQRRRRTEESDAPPEIVAEEDVLLALVEARPPRARRPPVIKLRTKPLHTDAKPHGIDVPRLTGLLDEIDRLRAQHQKDEREAEHQEELHRRELAQLEAKIEALEARRPEGPSAWAMIGSAAAGALATEVVRRGVDLLHVGDAQAGAKALPAAGALDGAALLERLLPVFDNLARTQQHAEQGAPPAAIAEGLRTVRGQLDEALVQGGVERVPTVGQLFDPSRHTAVEHVEAPLPGIVLREVLPGYTAGGRLLRVASVVVSKGQPLMLPK